jgi:hypothetical protein
MRTGWSHLTRLRVNVVVRSPKPVLFQEDERLGRVISFGSGDDAPLSHHNERCPSLIGEHRSRLSKSWMGFNASHSLAPILFGLVYGYLALSKGNILFGSPFLLATGCGMLLDRYADSSQYEKSHRVAFHGNGTPPPENLGIPVDNGDSRKLSHLEIACEIEISRHVILKSCFGCDTKRHQTGRG